MYGKDVNEKEANHSAHPIDKTANWCSRKGWFTKALSYGQITTTKCGCNSFFHIQWTSEFIVTSLG
jgi:hypothetical protein